ncbi:hypothetical protein O6H91_16G069900 [Diphasiastrum complanatum]|uniref:Uncharacterized protein n=1 Tax=Diphasiastrum complanatum TaxID=34168 RepID=A0ACC2BDE4_DIPCM|nr:hypothetical protein O6H91_16G069900 [Diphasiastrum complanatum]
MEALYSRPFCYSYSFTGACNRKAFLPLSRKPCLNVASRHGQAVFLQCPGAQAQKDRYPSGKMLSSSVFLNSNEKVPLTIKRHQSYNRSYNSMSIVRASQDDLLDKKQHSSSTISIPNSSQNWETRIEQAIFDFRFLTLFAGSAIVFECFKYYFISTWRHLGSGAVVLLLVEAIDVYLMGTVMLILGMGLYDLFVSSLNIPGQEGGDGVSKQTFSNLFGLFPLTERPKWLKVESLAELKTTLGHAIVMILLIGMFEKSKKVPISTGLDLLFLSTSILFTSGCLFLLSKLH